MSHMCFWSFTDLVQPHCLSWDTGHIFSDKCRGMQKFFPLSAFASIYLWISISRRAITVISSARKDQKHQKFQSLANCTFKCRDPKTRILTEPSGNSQGCEPLTGFKVHSVLFCNTSEGEILDSNGQGGSGAVDEVLRRYSQPRGSDRWYC